MFISAGQVIDLLHKDVYARVVQPCSPLCTPLWCLGHSSRLGYGGHRSQELPSIWLARHSVVVVAGGHCEEQSIRIYILCINNWYMYYILIILYTKYIPCKYTTYQWYILFIYYLYIQYKYIVYSTRSDSTWYSTSASLDTWVMNLSNTACA